jgi:hypothetical protein
MMAELESDALTAQQQWQAMSVAKESGGKGTLDSTLRVDGSHGVAEPKKPARQRSNARIKSDKS